MTIGMCVKFSLSPIFAISTTPNEDYDGVYLFFAVSIFFLRFQGGRELSEN